MNTNNNFIIATGNDKLNDFIAIKYKEFNFVTVSRKEDLARNCQMYNPQMLMVYDKLAGKENIYTILLDLSKNYPNTRIIFLTKEIALSDENKINSLSMLITAGIYDIYQFGDSIKVSQIQDIIINKRTFEDVKYIVDKSNEILGKTNSEEEGMEFIISEEVEEERDREDKNNIFMISSIKPGTGKSFVSTNVATAIAKYGIRKENGEYPKVGLVEADLQNLSVGTLLNIEDEKYNLFEALKRIDKLIDDTGNISCTQTDLMATKKFVLECFKPYETGNVKNLRALVGSQLTFEEVVDITPIHYAILLNLIEDEFDVIIIDSNSSLSHITTQAITNAAKKCFYVVNLDYNNVRNNIRYQSTLKDFGILDKTKYILNENLTEDMPGYENLVYKDVNVEESLDLIAKIPVLDKDVFLNCVFSAQPVVVDEDNPKTFKARYELLKIANQIYPLENIAKYEQQLQKNDTKQRKSFFGKR